MNEHITRLEVKNFKKFDHLVVENIGQINLITGDNNVGKTSLLESILIVNDDIDLSLKYLHQTLCLKEIHIHPHGVNSKNPIFPSANYFEYLKTDKKKPIEFIFDNSSISFEDCTIDDLTPKDFEKQKVDNYNIGRPNKWVKIYKNGDFKELQWMYYDDFKRNLKYGYTPYIVPLLGYHVDINDMYDETIGEEKPNNKRDSSNNDSNNTVTKFKELDFEEKKKFIVSLSLFVPDIEDTSIRNYFGREILSLKIKSKEIYHPITTWGEGFNEFVRYLLEIIKNKNRFLLIDEFATGVHWTKMKVFWLQIMRTSEINNVQLFCTTHSQDCINAFIEAGEELSGMKDRMRLIQLQESKSDKSTRNVYASTYNFEQIKSGLESDINLRGGRLYA
jgi:AAA15 family ATPase/GTPase